MCLAEARIKAAAAAAAKAFAGNTKTVFFDKTGGASGKLEGGTHVALTTHLENLHISPAWTLVFHTGASAECQTSESASVSATGDANSNTLACLLGYGYVSHLL